MNPVSAPPLGGTRALLQSLVPSLVPSERRVAQLCIDRPAAVAQMSAAEVGREAGVSPATVVRACQRMGFGGFQNLRELLIRDQAAPPAPAPRTAPAHPVEALFGRAIDHIHGALGALDFGVFDRAADRIRDARRLLVVGNGASLPPAQSVALHFLASGKVCEAPVDIVSQHISAKLLKPGDVCLAVSDSGMNRFTLRSARLAKEAGVDVVGITSYAKSDLAQIADFPLIAGADFHSLNDEAVTGNIVQMLLLSALHSAARTERKETLDAIADSMDVVREIVEPEILEPSDE
ncbi:MurR/RpiR family transcriptional regulator [Leucobacter sp. CSA2]|uniref:MurR/RpiR family transcriptional regulator n=1 Tax=Leucobacter edaphi TaxID=2796472 RepID=A0A934UXV8_9MICO|nr:MurR/RpiR family transcriptional regulator [Leucobacter edaphi]MBK0421743.1 MurR/RpiR family transcriptional regulator [Leucobacter edaphi]